ncbi:GNAT family N-acetyltransferase [Sphingomonas montana]|uniref:GNAT family N-acetyltransferase n=1 Tax=Sphingomonas montana TaxID=1843236 RepID=UPI00096E639B|nr:GNAT family N-acetyltransferase [Sphingomonas montana]
MFARTGRLLLRPGWAEDAPVMAAALCRPHHAVGTEAHAACVAAARAVLERPLPHARPHMLILRRGASAELIGTISLIDRGGAVQLDCWIRPDCRNRGYATEAGHATIAIAAMLGIARLECPLATDPAAAALLRKLGFRDADNGLVLYCAAVPHDPIDRLAA